MRGQVCPSRLEFDLQAAWAAHLVPRECTSSEIYIYKKQNKNINCHTFFWLVTIFYGVGDVTAQEQLS